MDAANRSEGLRRGLEILGIFREPRPEWGVSEIAREMSLHKNQVHRTLKTLVDAGFLQRCPKSARYSLGFGAFELGVEAGRHINLIPEARPLIEELAEKLQATVSIRVEDGDDMVLVENMENPGRLKVYSSQGNRRSWNFVGSGSKVFSAYWPLERVERLYRKFGLPRFTKNSVTRKMDMLKEIARIRVQGYAVSNGERSLEILGVAAPVFKSDGVLIAVLVAAMPSAGISKSRREEIVRTVARGARNVSDLFKEKFAPDAGESDGRRALRGGARSGVTESP